MRALMMCARILTAPRPHFFARRVFVFFLATVMLGRAAMAQDSLQGWDRPIFQFCMDYNDDNASGCRCMVDTLRDDPTAYWAAAVLAATNGQPTAYLEQLEGSQRRQFGTAVNDMTRMAAACGMGG